ncbi:FadR family transcriptional regulator [Neisseriaceae bacterium TC5R-5]|nr:FadR family transcriptional regulator [Neisseriaceae bacterium TC5R-5]
MVAAFQPIQAGARLSEQVATTLAQSIRAGQFSAGQKLPSEAQLAQQFNVSRTVIREAISQLKSLGLVTSRQGYGVLVQEPGHAPLLFQASHTASLAAVVQMVEVRRGLEAEAASLAAQRRSPEDVSEMHQILLALEQAVVNGDSGVDEDVNFHRCIAKAAANPFLLSTLDYLAQYLRGAIEVTRANEARDSNFLQQVQHEHSALLLAIEQGNAEAARQAMTQHLDNAILRIHAADPAFWEAEGYSLVQGLGVSLL